jgi:hypothetical protein
MFVKTQGKDQYIKRVHAYCYDCRPTAMRPLEWYCARHLVAGFANSLEVRQHCNCDFVTVGNDAYLKARHDIYPGDEIYVKYKFKK